MQFVSVLFCNCTINEFLEDRILTEQGAATQQKHLFTGAGEGHVQFAVDNVAVLREGVVGKEIQLVFVLDGETIDDDIALAALVPLHGVNGDGLPRGRSL